MSRNPSPAVREKRPIGRDIRPLFTLLTFVWPYRWRLLLAMFALLVAAAGVPR
jgi:hypothetical protein